MQTRRQFLMQTGIATLALGLPSIACGKPYNERPNWMRCLVAEGERRTFQNPVEDIHYYMRVLGLPIQRTIETPVHGDTHDLNNRLSQHPYGNGWTFHRGLYFLNGDYTVFPEPRITIEQVNENVPNTLKLTEFNGYYLTKLVSVRNNEPLYILDELRAFTHGAIYNSRVTRDNNRNGSTSLLEFVIYALALGKTIKEKVPYYWDSPLGKDLQDCLRFSVNQGFAAEVSQTFVKDPRQFVINRMAPFMDNNLTDFAKNSLGWS